MRMPPAWMLCLLLPTLALAQGAGPAEGPYDVTRSPLFWYWVVLLAMAAAIFIWRVFVISRRRGPPTTPRTP